MFKVKAYGNGQKIARKFDSRALAEAQLLAWLDAGWMVGSVAQVPQ